MIVCDLFDWQQNRKIEAHMKDYRGNRTRTSMEFWVFWPFVLVNCTWIWKSNSTIIAYVGDKCVISFLWIRTIFCIHKIFGSLSDVNLVILQYIFSDAESDDTDAYMSDTGSQISTYSCASRFSMTSTGSRRISR